MQVFLTSLSNKELQKLPTRIKDKLVSEISMLINDPYPAHCKKLSGKPGWRVRVGDYRIIYAVDNKKKEIMILSIAHRREVYR